MVIEIVAELEIFRLYLEGIGHKTNAGVVVSRNIFYPRGNLIDTGAFLFSRK
jgi:hypothetical protein